MNEHIISTLSMDEACKPSLLALRNMNTMQMMQHYIDKIDFSICSDTMNADFFLENSTKEQRDKSGIYVNRRFAKENPEIVIMIGESDSEIICDGFSVSQLFIRDNSICNLIIKDNAFCIIDCFGQSKTIINQTGNSNVCVNLYGNSKCEFTGKVKVNHKFKDKY